MDKKTDIDDNKETDKNSEIEIRSKSERNNENERNTQKDVNAETNKAEELLPKTENADNTEADKKIYKDKNGSSTAILVLTDLKKSFGSNTVLKDINLSVKKGETVVILGRSGTGKSVILKCIIGLILPDSGNIEVFGHEFLNLPEDQENALRIKMGFLFQSGALYDSMTVRQNLEFPIIRQPDYKKEDLTPKVTEALENVGLADAIDKVPSELS
ncbi:MAG: ATP-binding cassette domain-containing protein, partial [Bacteroidota bacterium]|nr:ATP-binding cassette domain-containing protein [Bacteroidota bacterium]